MGAFLDGGIWGRGRYTIDVVMPYCWGTLVYEIGIGLGSWAHGIVERIAFASDSVAAVATYVGQESTIPQLVLVYGAGRGRGAVLEGRGAASLGAGLFRQGQGVLCG